MNEFLKKYWMMAILISAPLVRHFTENSTIDALTGLAVWSLLWVIFAIVVLVVLIGGACHTWSDEMKVDGLDKMTKPFAKMKWWKSAINASLVLAAYIYVEWTGPAILYTINTVGLYGGMALLKSGMIKVMEANGIEIPEELADPDEKPDELKNLKKSSLL